MKEQLQLEPEKAAGHLRHDVFSRFSCWQGKVPEGFVVNFLGVMTRVSYFKLVLAHGEKNYPADRYVKTEYPRFDEEYFEWVDLLESAASAEGRFTMIELGAGWGPRVVNAAAALRQLDELPHRLIAVEAEPAHFEMMKQHIAQNGVEPGEFELIEAAVAPVDGKVGFQIDPNESRNWYGQAIGGSHPVDAVSLNTLLEPLATVDLIDLDVQGAEYEVLAAAAEAIDRKVKRIHIGTHSRSIEESLHLLFGHMGWRCVRSFPNDSVVETDWGPIVFQDGVQTWINPAFSRDATEAAILTQKLESCRQEIARLWAELEKSRKRFEGVRILEPGSLGRRLMDRGTRLLAAMAPQGSRRRKLMDFITKGV